MGASIQNPSGPELVQGPRRAGPNVDGRPRVSESGRRETTSLSRRSPVESPAFASSPTISAAVATSSAPPGGCTAPLAVSPSDSKPCRGAASSSGTERRPGAARRRLAVAAAAWLGGALGGRRHFGPPSRGPGGVRPAGRRRALRRDAASRRGLRARWPAARAATRRGSSAGDESGGDWRARRPRCAAPRGSGRSYWRRSRSHHYLRGAAGTSRATASGSATVGSTATTR